MILFFLYTLFCGAALAAVDTSTAADLLRVPRAIRAPPSTIIASERDAVDLAARGFRSRTCFEARRRLLESGPASAAGG